MTRLNPKVPAIVRVAAGVTLATAVLCQFLQHTDPTFPLLYFSVDSALLMALAVLLTPASPRFSTLHVIRGAATIGVVVSAVVYAAVIAPNSATGRWFAPQDDVFVRTSTALMHGIGPVLAIADFLTHDYPAASTRKTLAAWCSWPLVYILSVTMLAGLGIGRVPYTFLSPQSGRGALGVAGAMAALMTIVALLSYLLLRVHRGGLSGLVGVRRSR